MNATTAASAFQRHRFTVEEACVLEGTGALGDTRVEVIGGELIDMPADGPLHRRWTGALNTWLMGALASEAYVVLPNTTLRLAAMDGPSPDFQVFSASLDEADVDGHKVLLVIEQSDTTLAYDLGDKRSLYAAYGVRDYWVVDLKSRRLHVHREPGAQGYSDTQVFDADDPVEALLIPGLLLRLADLPRVGSDKASS